MDTLPSGKEIHDFTPNLISTEHLAAIGLMVASSSQAEGAVEMAIAGLLGIDAERGISVTAHMTFPHRIQLLKSSAEIHFRDTNSLLKLDNIIKNLEAAIAKRNAIVHDQWGRLPSTNEVFRLKHQARTHVVVDLAPVSAKQIKIEAQAVYEAGMALISFVEENNLWPNMPGDRPRGINTPDAIKKLRNSINIKSNDK